MNDLTWTALSLKTLRNTDVFSLKYFIHIFKRQSWWTSKEDVLLNPYIKLLTLICLCFYSCDPGDPIHEADLYTSILNTHKGYLYSFLAGAHSSSFIKINI